MSVWNFPLSLSLSLSNSLSLSLSLWPLNVIFLIIISKRVPTVLHGSDVYDFGFQNLFVHGLDFGRVHVCDHWAWGISISEHTKEWAWTTDPKESKGWSSRPALKLANKLRHVHFLFDATLNIVDIGKFAHKIISVTFFSGTTEASFLIFGTEHQYGELYHVMHFWICGMSTSCFTGIWIFLSLSFSLSVYHSSLFHTLSISFSLSVIILSLCVCLSFCLSLSGPLIRHFVFPISV